MEFSIRGMKNLIRSQGRKRVSKDSAVALSGLLEDYGLQVAESAVEYADRDGRETVRPGDVKKAVRRHESK